MGFRIHQFLLSVILTTCCEQLQAQPVLQHVEKLQAENGLSTNSVNNAVQDQYGFLWIASSHGLNRFDGSEVKQYFFSKNGNSISDNVIYKVIVYDTSHLVLATRKGLDIFDTRRSIFTKINLPNTHSDSSDLRLYNQISILEKDCSGNLWAGSSACVYRFNKDLTLQKTFYAGQYVKGTGGNTSKKINKLLPLSTGEILVWINSVAYIWEPDGMDTLTEVQYARNKNWSFIQGGYFLSYSIIYNHYVGMVDYDKSTFTVIDDQTFQKASCRLPRNFNGKTAYTVNSSSLKNGWISVSFESNGFVWIHLGEVNKKITLSSDGIIHLPEYNIGEMFEDREDNLWIKASQVGYLKFSSVKQHFRNIVLLNQQTKQPSSFVIPSFYKTGNILWIASYGDGIYKWNEATGTLHNYSAESFGRWSNLIWNFWQYNRDTLWVGTQQGILCFDIRTGRLGRLQQSHPSVLDSFPVTTQFVDSKGLVWMGVGFSKGLCNYDPGEKRFTFFPYADGTYPDKFPYAITEDNQGNLWFAGPSSANLVQWIRNENRFKKIILPGLDEVDNSNLGSLYFDKSQDVIWSGILSAGLVRYEIHSGKVRIFGFGQGLNSDRINGIYKDKNDLLWLSTAQGISTFDLKSEHFINYKNSDGLPGNYFSSDIFYDDSASRIYIGALGNVVYFSPYDFITDNSAMQVRLTELLINNESVTIPENRHLFLPYKENNLTVSFTGINLTNGAENRYAYRLKDNEAWIDVDAQRQLRFASLSPGIYQFTVRAASKGRDWSTLTDSIQIIIQKPYYLTVWFYLWMVLAVCIIIYSLYRYRLNKMKQVLFMRTQISHDLHDDIGSRLTNIGLMSLVARKSTASESLENPWLERIQKESENISQTLREIVWNINPENDSLEDAIPRMLQLAARLLEAKDMTVHSDIPDLKHIKLNMKKRRNLFGIFKEAIQNIANHSGAKHVHINAVTDKNILKFEITDDGKGFENQGQRVLNGIKYMQQRALMEKWILHIDSQPGTGTRLTLEMKIT